MWSLLWEISPGNNNKVFSNFNGNRISLIHFSGLFWLFYGQTIEIMLIELVIYTTEWSIKIDIHICAHRVKVITVTKKILLHYIRSCK